MDEDRLQPNQLNMSGCSRADMAIMTMIIIIQKTFMTKKILFRRIKKNMNSVKKLAACISRLFTIFTMLIPSYRKNSLFIEIRKRSCR